MISRFDKLFDTGLYVLKDIKQTRRCTGRYKFNQG